MTSAATTNFDESEKDATAQGIQELSAQGKSLYEAQNKNY